MNPSPSYDRAKGLEEHILSLPGGRQLAYAHNGPNESRTIVLFFTGLMSVGTAPDVSAPCRELGVHWIAPTLPGMGNCSTRDPTVSYAVSLARDMTALLQHLYPTNEFDAIYVAGGSYGSIPAQMIYGAPYDIFPAGRKIVGCVLLAGFSPAKYDTGYAKRLSWQNWFSIGPPSQLPFRPLQWVVRWIIASKFNTLDGAKAFLHATIFSHMSVEEKQMFAQYLDKHGRTESEFIDSGAKGAIRCCNNWDGFMEVSDVLRSDWGFEPAKLDDEHAAKPLLVVGSMDDHLGGDANDWVAKNYRSATLKRIPGGHISALYFMDEIWQELIDRAPPK